MYVIKNIDQIVDQIEKYFYKLKVLKFRFYLIMV